MVEPADVCIYTEIPLVYPLVTLATVQRVASSYLTGPCAALSWVGCLGFVDSAELR
jgi:hypothetical protein